MISDGHIEKLDEAIEVLQTTLHPYAVYLFGSVAENRLRPDSDIDIAYLSDMDMRLSNYERFQLAQTLALILNRDVDLVDLADTTTVFCAEIVARGQVILDLDRERRLVFAAKAFKEYALLNERRMCVIEAIRLEAKHHGQRDSE